MLSSIIVIPCYNEEQRLQGETFLRYVASSQSTRLLFVNDGSTDGTSDVLHHLAEQAPQAIDVCDLPQNGGKAEAVRQGLLAALTTDAECLGFLDADLASPLESIPLFLDVFQRRPDIDVVIGSRLPLLGRHIHRNAKRQILGRLFASVASQVLWTPVRDTQCGAKMFRNSSLLRTALSRPFLARWIFDVELLARMKQLRQSQGDRPLDEVVFEQPLDEWYEVAGSKLRLRDFARAPWELVQIYFRYLSPWAEVANADVFPMPLMRPFERIPAAHHPGRKTA